MSFYLVTGENTVLVDDYLNNIVTSFGDISIDTLPRTASLEDIKQTYDIFERAEKNSSTFMCLIITKKEKFDFFLLQQLVFLVLRFQKKHKKGAVK